VARRAVPYLLVVTATLYCLLFFGLTATGLLGPDEPRYAAIGREMARSGDWVTPRLWGEPWFEKPALLYWMTGAGFRAGLGEDLAPRLPVALVSAAFLLAYGWLLRREFGWRAAFFATAALAASAGWLGFSCVGLTDVPLAAAFCTAMLLWLPLVTGQPLAVGRAAAAGALLGLAVLAKGLVPLVLALPLVFTARRRLKELFHPAALAAFLLVAAPWYLLCWKANGWTFIQELFIKHHVSRFSTEALQHPQPIWFFLPVLLAGMFPWTPLAALLFNRRGYQDPRRRFLLLWVLFGLVFFSVSVNKLPGYLLPLLPAVSALAGLALAEARRVGGLLAACAALVALLPVVGAVLPGALLEGLRKADVAPIQWAAMAPALVAAALAWRLEALGRRAWAVATVLGVMTAGVVWLKLTAFPEVDRVASARAFWREVAPQAKQLCVETANRGWRYGLYYYSVDPLPDCANTPDAWRIRQSAAGVRLEPPH